MLYHFRLILSWSTEKSLCGAYVTDFVNCYTGHLLIFGKKQEIEAEPRLRLELFHSSEVITKFLLKRFPRLLEKIINEN